MDADLDGLRDELHLALIQADVGEAWQHLVDLMDALVSAAVLHALNEDADLPF